MHHMDSVSTWIMYCHGVEIYQLKGQRKMVILQWNSSNCSFVSNSVRFRTSFTNATVTNKKFHFRGRFFVCKWFQVSWWEYWCDVKTMIGAIYLPLELSPLITICVARVWNSLFGDPRSPGIPIIGAPCQNYPTMSSTPWLAQSVKFHTLLAHWAPWLAQSVLHCSRLCGFTIASLPWLRTIAPVVRHCIVTAVVHICIVSSHRSHPVTAQSAGAHDCYVSSAQINQTQLKTSNTQP